MDREYSNPHENTETVITQREDNVVTGGAGAGEGTANIGDNETPQAGPVEVVDLDDNQTPTTNAPGTDATDIDDNKTPGANWPLIGGGAALLVAIAAAALILARRRREEEEE